MAMSYIVAVVLTRNRSLDVEAKGRSRQAALNADETAGVVVLLTAGRRIRCNTTTATVLHPKHVYFGEGKNTWMRCGRAVRIDVFPEAGICLGVVDLETAAAPSARGRLASSYSKRPPSHTNVWRRCGHDARFSGYPVAQPALVERR